MEVKSPWFAGRMRSVRSLCALITRITIFFFDEDHFNLNGYVNQQNCRYWYSENPKEKHETQLHSLKVTVWCTMHLQGIIGSRLFEDGRGRAVTVDSVRYVDMLNDLYEPASQNFDGYNRDTWFQQDEAICHFSIRSLSVIRVLFSEKLIARHEDLSWTPEDRT